MHVFTSLVLVVSVRWTSYSLSDIFGELLLNITGRRKTHVPTTNNSDRKVQTSFIGHFDQTCLDIHMGYCSMISPNFFVINKWIFLHSDWLNVQLLWANYFARP